MGRNTTVITMWFLFVKLFCCDLRLVVSWFKIEDESRLDIIIYIYILLVRETFLGHYHGRYKQWGGQRGGMDPWRITHPWISREMWTLRSMWIPTHHRITNSWKCRAPHGRARPPAVVASLAMAPGLRLDMVNVKPSYSLDLEIDCMKQLILEYKRYTQKWPRQLLRSMQQFVLEEHLDILCNEDWRSRELARDEFITTMFRIHQANSSGK